MAESDPVLQEAESNPVLQIAKRYRNGEISWKQYIDGLFPSSNDGSLGGGDFEKFHKSVLLAWDYFAYAVTRWSGRVKDVAALEVIKDVLYACTEQPLADIRAQITVLSDQHGKCVRQSLATLAVVERMPELLQYCLEEGGFTYEDELLEAAAGLGEDEDPVIYHCIDHFNVFGQDDATKAEKRDDVVRTHAARVFDIDGPFPVEW